MGPYLELAVQRVDAVVTHVRRRVAMREFLDLKGTLEKTIFNSLV